MTNEMTSGQLIAAREYIKVAVRLIEAGSNEQVVRDHFTSSLRALFPDTPKWIAEHVRGGEAALKTHRKSRVTTGFVDNLIGLTPIEYEANLLNPAKFAEGYGQVQKYCASLVNDQNDPTQTIGVLSDTVRWHAYSIVVKPGHNEPLEAEDIELQEIDSIDVSAATDVDARRLIDFLLRYLQRLGSRPLDAFSIAHDLGFESPFCERHFVALSELVREGFSAKPEYATLIKELWCSFVSYVIAKGKTSEFDVTEYTRELYILTLGKLICANAIEARSLVSNEGEIVQIISGDFFRNRGLENFVEYDYFGWLNGPGRFQRQLISVAREIQQDLRAYDFSRTPGEDIFGRLMAQLAERSQRILLGQECTPTWLAGALVHNTIQKLPRGIQPCFVDMCCGSGTMVLEVVRQVKQRIEAEHDEIGKSEKIDLLTQAITGFDIDPLAVMLSKIAWVLAAKDWLEPFGTDRVTIPIYHADSLFATTPLSKENEDDGLKVKLHLAEHTLELPTVLISAGWQGVFDSVIDRAYSIAIQAEKPVLTKEDMDGIIDGASRFAPGELSKEDRDTLALFLFDLIDKIHILNVEGRNGIWAFILRNNYRPGLVAGQFNGLVSNPPWLALSKIADNPYKGALQAMAESLGVRPQGPSFLHLEMSTIFLLRSVDRYLREDAVFGCVVPETVLNGHQHNLFRAGAFAETERPVSLSIDEIWKVDERAFKNRAAVLFGKKSVLTNQDPIPGRYIAQDGSFEALQFHRVALGPRIVWTDRHAVDATSLFHPADFEQGADIMPRRLFFHEVRDTEIPGTVSLEPIEEGASNLTFLISDAKQSKDFRLSIPCVVPERYVFRVLLSKMLSPFVIADSAKAFLPLRRSDSGEWTPLSEFDLSQDAADASALRAFTQIAQEIAKLDNIPSDSIFEGMWKRLNFRNKIGKQSIIDGEGYLVFTGAGGSDVCAGFISLEEVPNEKLLVDQTLYWSLVSTEEEALYLAGLLNSDAANELIKAFQPRGQQGERHIHELAFGITPPFDPEQQSHIEVVNLTRVLLKEYFTFIEEKQKVGDRSFLQWLQPGRSLARRRSKLREVIRTVPTYADYTSACRAVYGV